MSSDASVGFVVYNVTSYFWKQPNDLAYRPICGESISSSAISPSKAVTSSLEQGSGAIPAHYFSYLYKCTACSWWGVRESWAFLEASGTNDYLVMERNDKNERKKSKTSPWKQALEDLNLYNKTQPLPDNLGKLFVGGESYVSLERLHRSLWNDVREFALTYAKERAKKK